MLLGNTSEREFMKKINKMREKMNKKSHSIKKEFTKLEKTKANLLKKTEDDNYNIERELEKIEKKIYRSKDLAPESKRRLNVETSSLKMDTKDIYFDLKTRIAETFIPA
jgi:hypothetical protein